MIESLNHCSFTVADLERSVTFYRNILGMRVADVSGRDPAFSARVTGIPGAELRIAYLKTENTTLELVQYLSPTGERIDTRTCNVGSAHVCYNVSDFDEMVRRLRENG